VFDTTSRTLEATIIVDAQSSVHLDHRVPLYTPPVKPIIPWLLAAAAGIALALALPGLHLIPMILVFPGLTLEAIGRAPGRWRPWWLGLLAGTVHWMVATNWVMPVMHHYGGLPMAFAVVCLAGMGLLLGLLWALAFAVTALIPGSLRLWAFPCAFMAVDAWRQFWPYRFPWNPPAATFAEWPAMLQSLPVWGATGLGWAALAAGAGVWGLLRAEHRRAGALSLTASVGSWLALGVLAPPPDLEGESVRIAVIQPGTSLEQKWDPANWRDIEEKVWRMTAEAAAERADIVLWPESALPYRADSDSTYREVLEGSARDLGMAIVLNSVGAAAGGGYTNSVFVVRPDGMAGERYDKVRLVPFGEFVPWWASMAFTESLVREVGSFEPGRKPVVLNAGVPIGMAICYEVIFADLLAHEVRSGAEVLATVTNDGWYGYSWAPRQHFAAVVLRAAESRRWFARAALTGISGFVDPVGRVRSRIELGDEGLLIEEVQTFRGITPRSRLGDWWWAVCSIASLALIVASRFPRRRQIARRG
jgi:apolipoprotein N-acyltransferase